MTLFSARHHDNGRTCSVHVTSDEARHMANFYRALGYIIISPARDAPSSRKGGRHKKPPKLTMEALRALLEKSGATDAQKVELLTALLKTAT